ncbi:MAG: hypothetical protein AABX00_03405 [Nanoarchaeota archaeon]
MIKCYKCGNEYTMDKMRMESSKMRLVCRNCLEGKQVVKQETKQAGKPVKSEASPMQDYFCKGCKYSFKRAKHLDIRTCPYCDSKSVITRGSTARIIADAAKMKGDF